MLYIDDLIQKLTEIKNEKGNLEVCKIGHFGEINEMSIYDISVDTATDYNEAKGSYKKRKVVNIDAPDIGPEPD
jgi:hypothetical protein